MREELAGSRLESDALRQEVQALRDRLDARQSGTAAAPAADVAARVDALAEAHDLLAAKVDDQEQTKVESASKYHVRLSGIALVDLFSTNGAVDDVELPTAALPQPPGDVAGSFGAGVRQSRIGLEVFGPAVGGARTSGEVTFDFFGGFPAARDGLSAPLLRLRTATLGLEWSRTSVAFGQDAPFFSPRSPTSLASTAYPALSSAGNLWTWTPQVRVEHRIAAAGGSTLVVQEGLLDAFTGEVPAREYSRVATAGERSRVPAQAVRVGWQRDAPERSAAIGGGAYHARQNWAFDRSVDAWAVTTDWQVPLGGHLSWTGELYRGSAIGGLGGGIGDSVVLDGPLASSSTSVRPVASRGGWTQLKVRLSSTVEINSAYGADRASAPQAPETLVLGVAGRNASAFTNAIYQARSNVFFSLEYRRLWTATTAAPGRHTAGHFSFTTGIVF
jgi:hypothetical protein